MRKSRSLKYEPSTLRDSIKRQGGGEREGHGGGRGGGGGKGKGTTFGWLGSGGFISHKVSIKWPL